MRVQSAIGVDTGIQQQAEIVPVSENAMYKFPADFAQLLFPFRIPEQILAALADRNVGVHSATIHSDHRLWQKGRCAAHSSRNLAANELVELNLVGRRHDLAVAIVDF